ncbi:hypothetical protein L484_009196 [Morus notabilis]|uniref:Transmembrane protein n=1 Tax=Morus notabilis TaxID=981085 RepID=W9SGH5_9ROSA|nr:hypothetical protein L484_009196 [Morus notabilis]
MNRNPTRNIFMMCILFLFFFDVVHGNISPHHSPDPFLLTGARFIVDRRAKPSRPPHVKVLDVQKASFYFVQRKPKNSMVCQEFRKYYLCIIVFV